MKGVDHRLARHLFFSWPLIETAVGKALEDYEQALVEECLADESRDTLHRRTFELREKLTAEIMKLIAAGHGEKPIWLEPELNRLGIT